jgi:hypothetical protein
MLLEFIPTSLWERQKPRGDATISPSRLNATFATSLADPSDVLVVRPGKQYGLTVRQRQVDG